MAKRTRETFPGQSHTEDELEAAVFVKHDLIGDFGGKEETKFDVDDTDAVHRGDGSLVAAWEDPDDDELDVDIASKPILKKLRKKEGESIVSGREFSARLKSQFQKMRKNVPEWSLLPEQRDSTLGNDDEKEEEEYSIPVVQDSKSYTSIAQKSEGIPSVRISVSRCKDANVAEPNQAVVQSVQFNPTVPLLLTAGLDKTLRLFQVDGTKNPKLDSIYFPDMPIFTASFSNDGEEIICSGRRKFFYSIDVAKGSYEKVHGILGREERSLEKFVMSPDNQTIAFMGNDGYILLVNRHTKLLKGTLRMNGSVRALSFSEDGSQLYSIGGEGKVYLWDMRSSMCVAVKIDEGSLCGTAISVSGKTDYFATGSDSGIVNTYETKSMFSKDEILKPAKVFGNLVTTIDTLKFNPTGELLAIGSRMKKDSLRLIHMPTQKVYSNWPTARTPIHYVHSFDFSPSSGYIAIGNDKGRALLYRLNHYDSV